jgi:ABC-type antimicrobial peptide transport system permease subunit
LGLLGLASYSTERKKKEISIRKVLGATLQDLLMLLSAEFVILTIIALIIGSPLAYYLMDNFLSSYAYRVDLDGNVFLIAGAGLLLTTLLVISFQLVRAGLGNPVNNLRNE